MRADLGDAFQLFLSLGICLLLCQRPCFFRVASGKADLIDGRLQSSVGITEWGEYLSGWGAWTGTTEDGLVASDTCNNWTDSSGSFDGVTGLVNLVDDWWTTRAERDCSYTNYRLYCFSQVPFLFADGFELGDWSRWSHTVP